MIIRRINVNDLPKRVEWMNNPKIYSSMHYEVPVFLEKTIQWYNKNLMQNNRIDLVVCKSDSPNTIYAFAGFVSIDRAVNKSETYLFVDPNLIGTGIGTRAKALMIEYGFTQLGLNKLYVITNEDNYASIKIQEKFGYRLEGRFREEYRTPEGILQDRLYYGLLKRDWENANNCSNI